MNTAGQDQSKDPTRPDPSDPTAERHRAPAHQHQTSMSAADRFAATIRANPFVAADPESHLDQQQAAIATHFAEQLRADPQRAWHAYCAMPETSGGRMVNVDLARLLCPEYACNNRSMDEIRRARTRLTPATYRTAKAYCDAAFAALLEQSPRRAALFSSGGPASGKTMVLRKHSEALEPAPGSLTPIVYDTAFSDYTKALQDIDRCGARPVRIVYVGCDFAQAMHSMLDRALRPGDSLGRYISAQRMARLHHGARTTILHLGEACQRGPLQGRDVQIVYNLRTAAGDRVEQLSLEQLRDQGYPTELELAHVAHRVLDQRRSSLTDDFARAVSGASGSSSR